MILYPATTNLGKFTEFSKSAATLGVEIEKLPGIDLMPEPVEDASTFMGNAEIKAIAYSRLVPGALVFADDSGLEVDALGGQPGVRSARFADDLNRLPDAGCRDTRNNLCLLSLLDQLASDSAEDPSPSRRARYVCALALACDGEVLLRTEGEVQGEILLSPRGVNGFGYDPLFLVLSLGQTMAELAPDQKWAVSHRGNAFRSLLAELDQIEASRPAGGWQCRIAQTVR
jgi:XTP/dITP diphosphohydrolase